MGCAKSIGGLAELKGREIENFFQIPDATIENYDGKIEMTPDLVAQIAARGSKRLPRLEVESQLTDGLYETELSEVYSGQRGPLGVDRFKNRYWIGRRFFLIEQHGPSQTLANAVQTSLLREQQSETMEEFKSAQTWQFLRTIGGVSFGYHLKMGLKYGEWSWDIVEDGVRFALEMALLGRVMTAGELLPAFVTTSQGQTEALLAVERGSLLADLTLTAGRAAIDGIDAVSALKLALLGIVLRDLPKSFADLRIVSSRVDVVPANPLARAAVEDGARLAAAVGISIGVPTPANLLQASARIRAALLGRIERLRAAMASELDELDQARWAKLLDEMLNSRTEEQLLNEALGLTAAPSLSEELGNVLNKTDIKMRYLQRIADEEHFLDLLGQYLRKSLL